MMWKDADWVPISALNHYLFCPRRCALIHVEGIFQDNVYTVEGSLLHEATDVPSEEQDGEVRVVRGLPLFSARYGLIGRADVVEFQPVAGSGQIPYPVDYKHGRRNQWDNDDVQLCAQALCLEEMLGISCPRGAIFHAGSKKRRVVEFSQALRAQTIQAVVEVRQLMRARRIPEPILLPRCDGCSLREQCMPRVGAHSQTYQRLRESLFKPV